MLVFVPMKSAIFFLVAAFLSFQAEIPKNDPTGVWVSEVGTLFQIRLNGGTAVSVRLAPDPNSRYSNYEVELQVDPQEKNTYAGKGFFVVKMKEGKECRFDTEWKIIVVQKETIVGQSTNIVPDADTCAVRESSQIQMNLKKKTGPSI
jgi:hypothetical protein